MVFKSAKLPLYLGMAVLTITILIAALELGTKTSVTQTNINAAVVSPTLTMSR